MLNDWLPQACSRQQIFLSYPSDRRAAAEDIAQTLKNDGHEVFFDKESLPAAGDYNERIRKAIKTADRCIILVTKSALEPGKYTLTELGFIKERWPAPAGKVFPVLLDASVNPGELPAYLRSVQATQIAGNAAAEVAATIERSRGLSGYCKSCVAIAGLGIVAAAFFGLAGVPILHRQVADITLLSVENVYFRPRAKTPVNPAAPGAVSEWINSPLTVTLMSVSYNSRNETGSRARLLNEEVELHFGSSTEKYKWTYIVNILSEKPCDDGLCRVGNVGVENLDPGKSTPPRETMFLPAANEPMIWKSFIDQVLSKDGPNVAEIVLRSKVDTTNGTKPSEVILKFVCDIDVAAARASFAKRGFKPSENPRPVFWQPSCKPK